MVATYLISFNKWLFHYILCLFSFGFELQLGGAVQISPRVLEVLKLALFPPHINHILLFITCQVTGYIIFNFINCSKIVFINLLLRQEIHPTLGGFHKQKDKFSYAIQQY